MPAEDTSPQVVVDRRGDLANADLPADAEPRLRAVMAATLRRVGLAGWYEVSLVLTDDREMRRVNRRHRGIDKQTDVLSFPQSDAPLLPLAPDEAWAAHAFGDDTHAAPVVLTAPLPQSAASQSAVVPPRQYGTSDNPYLLGDIMISMPTIARQAAAVNHSAWYELCFLISHGILHLIGYDDYYEPGYRAMVAHQAAVLTALAIS